MPKKPKSTVDLPSTVPVFPLSGALLLPQTSRPLTIFEPRYLQMVDDALGGNRLITLVQPKDLASEESPAGSVELQDIGCLGRITHFEETAQDRYFIILDGITRITMGQEVHADAPYRTFEISGAVFSQDFQPGWGEDAVDRPRFEKLLHTYSDFADLEMDWEDIDKTSTADLVNLCCMLSPYGPGEKQVLLEAKSLSERAETLIAMAEMEMARSQSGNSLQ